MPFFDLPQEQLGQYRAPQAEPADFDEFWQATLAEARQHPLDPQFVPVDSGLRTVTVDDVTFSGYGGQRIKGWFIRPAHIRKPLPCVVEYIGYGGGRNLPHSWLWASAAGYAHLVMDTRGQGSAGSPGDTPDMPDGANPFHPGFMTQGILNRDHYYYRRLMTDAARAIETAMAHPDVDATRIAVTGGSQGGGLAIAAASLMRDQVSVCMADVPFLCHFRRAVGLTENHPYQEIVNYLKIHRGNIEQVFSTLDYFDGVFHSARITADSLYSVALMDPICPPSTVYAAYNALTAQKQITVYPFNNHEGGQDFQSRERIRFLHKHWENA